MVIIVFFPVSFTLGLFPLVPIFNKTPSSLLLYTTAVIVVFSMNPLIHFTVIPKPIQDSPVVVSAVHLFTLGFLTTNLKTKLYLVTTLLLFLLLY